MLRAHYLWFGACLVTFAAGSEYRRHLSPATPGITVQQLRVELAKHERSRPQRLACAATVDPELLRQEVERAVSGALTSGGARLNGRGSVDADADADIDADSDADIDARDDGAEPSANPSADAAYERLSQRIDQSLQRRRWTEEDATTLQHQLSLVDDDRRGELMSRISVAINEGRLAFEGMGMPY